MVRSAAGVVLMALLMLQVDGAEAQSSSLYGAPQERKPLTLSQTSWYHVPVFPPRQIQLNDIITVIVEQRATVLSEGLVDRRTQSNIDARLQDWVKFEGVTLKPDLQSDGDQRIRALLNSQLRANSGVETAERMAFRIAATVVDIRPNGTFVIEAHRDIKVNNETWEAMLTGIVRPQDVTPANEVYSEDVAELRVEKRETGHVRDGYRRGWLLRLIDQYKPF